MSYQSGRQPLDGNGRTLTQLGMVSADSQALSASGATANVPIFTVTGTIQVNAIYGVVTTALGNCTAAYWRFNDGSNQSNITLNTGTTLTNAGIGAAIVKKGLAGAALTLLNSDQERVSEPTTLETLYFSPFVLTAKNGTTTNIEFTYTTSDTPTSGAITFYLGWVPLSADGAVTPL